MDGLRGLAAFIVVIHHFACAFFPALIFGEPGAAHSHYEMLVYKTPVDLLVAGNFAVCIFFVLSGFVLTHKFFVTGDSNAPRSGAARRYFRLMPAVLASVLISYALNKAGLFYNQAAAGISGSAWFAISWAEPAHILSALKVGLYSAFFTGNNISEYNNVLWTMKIEFFGSFLVFGAALLFGKLRGRWLAYLVLTLIFWKTYYLAFIIGVVLADLHAHQQLKPSQFAKPVGWVALALGLLLGSLAVPGTAFTYLGDVVSMVMVRDQAFVFFHIVGATLLVASLLILNPLRTFFNARPLQYLGKISFALYLVHQLVMGSFGAYAFLQFNGHMSYNFAVALSFLLSLPIIFVVADRLTYYVDRNAIKYSGVIYRRFFDPSSRVPDPSAPQKARHEKPAAAADSLPAVEPAS